MSECLGIATEGGGGRNAILDEWAVAALRQNMSIVATDPDDSGHLLGELRDIIVLVRNV